MAISDRKQRERRARMQLILNAAARIFARYGYHRASMDLIAEEAELGKATLYYYYKNKDELLLGIITEGIKDFFHQLEEDLKTSTDPTAQLELVIRDSMRFFEKHPDYFRLYMYLNVHPAFRRKIHQRTQDLLSQKIKIVKDIFDKGQSQGRFKAIPSEYLQSIFGSMVMGMGIFTSHKLSHDQLAEQAKYLKQVLFEGILNQEKNPS